MFLNDDLSLVLNRFDVSRLAGLGGGRHGQVNLQEGGGRHDGRDHVGGRNHGVSDGDGGGLDGVSDRVGDRGLLRYGFESLT